MPLTDHTAALPTPNSRQPPHYKA